MLPLGQWEGIKAGEQISTNTETFPSIVSLFTEISCHLTFAPIYL